MLWCSCSDLQTWTRLARWHFSKKRWLTACLGPSHDRQRHQHGQAHHYLYLRHPCVQYLLRRWLIAAAPTPHVLTPPSSRPYVTIAACGLCFKCGERWGHDHVCPTSVQLHVVEELLDLFGLDNDINTQVVADGDDGGSVMAISRLAVTGGVSPKAFQLRAWIQGREVLLLVDSGSSNSFINEQLASCIAGVQPLQ